MPGKRKSRPTEPVPPPPAVRLRIRWRRGEWQRVKQIRLPSKTLSDTTLPKSGKGGASLQGLWFEAVDRSGRVILRRRILAPLPITIDRSAKEGEFARAANPDEFLMDLLMLADPDIAAVRLLANPNPFQPPPKGAVDKPSLLAVFELKPPEATDNPEEQAR